MADYSNLKERFLKNYSVIQRKGADELLKYLETTDFFVAPASTKYHLSCEAGLLEHSLNVCSYLHFLTKDLDDVHKYSDETIVLVSLLHDICKANMYVKETKNRKVNGQWEEYPAWSVDNKFPAGHGEKSVMLIQKYMQLTDEELMAINWHMGAYDPRAREGYDLGNAMNKYPLIVYLHMADLHSTYITEAGR